MKLIILPLLCGAALLAAGCSTNQKADSVTATTQPAKPVSAAPRAADVPAKSDAVALQGTWKGHTVRDNPEHECTFVIFGKNFDFHDDTETNVWYKGTFSLKEDVVPRQYTALITDCPFPQYNGKTSLAIYRIQGDTLTITANEPGKESVPASFENEESACIELKRR